jgi:hypothetical protein
MSADPSTWKQAAEHLAEFDEGALIIAAMRAEKFLKDGDDTRTTGPCTSW